MDQCVQYLLSSRDVEERNPDQDGEYALSGKKKHHEAGKAEEGAKAVSDDLEQKGDGGMAFMSLFHNRGMDEKIIAGGLGDKKGDEQQTDQKRRC